MKKMSLNLSIQSRMMLTIMVGLICLVLTHLTLDAYYARSSYIDVRDRLEGFASSYTSKFILTQDGSLITSDDSAPDPKFNTARSGLYAVVFDGPTVVWRSPSSQAQEIPLLPERVDGESGVGIFSKGDANSSNNLHRLRMPMMIESSFNNTDTDRMYTIMVYEDGTLTDARVNSFTYALWMALGLSFVFILFSQSIALRWSVKPLQYLKKELGKVRCGSQHTLQGTYPKELEGVAHGLNDLLVHEKEQLETHRNSLANLAHSLKTPLAVLTSSLDYENPERMKQEFRDQIKRMNELVSYQLSLASRAGRLSFTAQQDIEVVASDLVQSLEKLHQAKRAYCEFEIEPNISYPMNKGDLQELMGNVLENAFKWCKSRVLLTVCTDYSDDAVKITIEDDGSGVPKEKINDIMKRGVRADEHVHGHGIGMAIVEDILRSYDGSLQIDQSEELGGARFIISLPIKH